VDAPAAASRWIGTTATSAGDGCSVAWPDDWESTGARRPATNPATAALPALRCSKAIERGFISVDERRTDGGREPTRLGAASGSGRRRA
jgi:hypothetical protein